MFQWPWCMCCFGTSRNSCFLLFEWENIFSPVKFCRKKVSANFLEIFDSQILVLVSQLVCMMYLCVHAAFCFYFGLFRLGQSYNANCFLLDLLCDVPVRIKMSCLPIFVVRANTLISEIIVTNAAKLNRLPRYQPCFTPIDCSYNPNPWYIRITKMMRRRKDIERMLFNSFPGRGKDECSFKILPSTSWVLKIWLNKPLRELLTYPKIMSNFIKEDGSFSRRTSSLFFFLVT